MDDVDHPQMLVHGLPPTCDISLWLEDKGAYKRRPEKSLGWLLVETNQTKTREFTQEEHHNITLVRYHKFIFNRCLNRLIIIKNTVGLNIELTKKTSIGNQQYICMDACGIHSAIETPIECGL